METRLGSHFNFISALVQGKALGHALSFPGNNDRQAPCLLLMSFQQRTTDVEPDSPKIVGVDRASDRGGLL